MTTDNKQRMTIFINRAMAKQARAQAVVEEVTLTELVENALIKYLPDETIVKKIEIRQSIKA